MTPEQLAGVRALAESLPPGTPLPLPRELVLELLGGSTEAPTADGPASPDLTVAEVAERYHRKPSTIRGWILAGRLRSYLFQGREHRVTLAALQEFEEAERSESPGAPRAQPRLKRTKPVDLASWRTAS